MADARITDKRTDLARREERNLTRSDIFRSPFQMLDRFADEMDRLFEDFGFGRRWLNPRSPSGSQGLLRAEAWLPDVEMFQRSNELAIRSDLPGLGKDDVKVELTEGTVTIQGERKREHEEEKGGVYRSERSYGSFYRVIELPEGAMTDQAKATFKDGVLEITMPAPPESVKRGRRLEISEGAAPKK